MPNFFSVYNSVPQWLEEIMFYLIQDFSIHINTMAVLIYIHIHTYINLLKKYDIISVHIWIYKINTHKPVMFLYTNNVQSEGN